MTKIDFRFDWNRVGPPRKRIFTGSAPRKACQVPIFDWLSDKERPKFNIVVYGFSAKELSQNTDIINKILIGRGFDTDRYKFTKFYISDVAKPQ